MKTKEKILIFGSGGHGKVVLDILIESGANILGFIDENKDKTGQKVNGYKIFGDWLYLNNLNNIKVALGIGNNAIRARVFKKLSAMNIGIIAAVHPRAIISRNVKIGEGVEIMPGAVINTGTTLEDGVIVNTGAIVDHDCRLERFCQIWPGAHLAGMVRVGEFSYVGTGAAVINNVSIGKRSIIGAGAAVVANIPDDVVAVGVPAKIIKENK